jgi:hypothetical protein
LWRLYSFSQVTQVSQVSQVSDAEGLSRGKKVGGLGALPARWERRTRARQMEPKSELTAKPGAWVDLGLTLPVFLVYHFGVVFLNIHNAADVVTYLAYTLDPETSAFFNSRWLWLTAPFTLVGILRFLFLVSGRAGKGLKSESPTQEMLRDVPFVLNLLLWVIVIVAIVYRLRPST